MTLECFSCWERIEAPDRDELFHDVHSKRVRHLRAEGGRLRFCGIVGLLLRPTPHAPACHTSEACIVWRHPKTGEIRYPGRNDVPMPGRYRSRGYECYEMRTIREIERFEKRHGVINEKVWCDGTSSRGLLDESREHS